MLKKILFYSLLTSVVLNFYFGYKAAPLYYHEYRVETSETLEAWARFVKPKNGSLGEQESERPLGEVAQLPLNTLPPVEKVVVNERVLALEKDNYLPVKEVMQRMKGDFIHYDRPIK